MSQDKPDTNTDDKAAELIRRRIDALYGDETGQHEKEEHHGLVDKFWHQHHAHPNPNAAWRDYYDTLSEKDKHKLWKQYHLQVDSSGVPKMDASETRPHVEDDHHFAAEPVNTKRVKRSRVADKAKTRSFSNSFFRNHIWPIISAAMIVASVWFVFNNELVVAKVKQYISPGNSNLTPAIIDPSVDVGSAAKVIIPKINVEVPVVYGVTTRDEKAIQGSLEDGVVHYAGTSFPGQIGNNVIVGHSSNNFFNGGKYKFAFVLLNRLELDDTFILNYQGTRYVYRVVTKQVVDPDDFSLIQQTDEPIATLITCDPPGTSWRRLIVQGIQISPDPGGATRSTTEIISPTDSQIIPGNAPSLWERFWGWVF